MNGIIPKRGVGKKIVYIHILRTRPGIKCSKSLKNVYGLRRCTGTLGAYLENRA
jgi:hypothetical protein